MLVPFRPPSSHFSDSGHNETPLTFPGTGESAALRAPRALLLLTEATLTVVPLCSRLFSDFIVGFIG